MVLQPLVMYSLSSSGRAQAEVQKDIPLDTLMNVKQELVMASFFALVPMEVGKGKGSNEGGTSDGQGGDCLPT